MGRLRAELQAKYKNREGGVKIHSPCELVTAQKLVEEIEFGTLTRQA